MRETESLCAENIHLKDIARSRREEPISREELIMYYRFCFLSTIIKTDKLRTHRKRLDHVLKYVEKRTTVQNSDGIAISQLVIASHTYKIYSIRKN